MNIEARKTGIISNIQRFSLDDGPGIRTTVFMQGCNLRCIWCHNPETQPMRPAILFEESLCRDCKICISVCHNKAHYTDHNGHHILRDKCDSCGMCVEKCPGNALSMSGKDYTVTELLEIVEKDLSFYDTSGGGVTFSGGEPLLQADFVRECLMYFKEKGINTAVDTAGAVDAASIGKVAQYTDLFLYDLKLMDSDKHKLYVGESNDKILYNLKKIAENGIRYYIRIPLIEVVNCDRDNTDKCISFLNELCMKPERVDLLPYHTYGIGKYKNLGISYSDNLTKPNAETINSIITAFRKAGFNVTAQ